MADDAVSALYQAFVSQDAGRAIAIVEKARSAGYRQAQIFDQMFAPAMALLGAAWAKSLIDEYQFASAAVVAEQVAGFVTPPPVASDTGVTVLLGTMQGDVHTVDKNIAAAALREAGHRVIDLGADVSPAMFLQRAEESGARIVIVFAQMVGPAAEVRRIREMFVAGKREIALFVSGAPFTADPDGARLLGANGIVKGARSALTLVEKAVRQIGLAQ